MAQPATNPKIEELRFKLKTDPKSRLFYQLAEELRRAGQFSESEKVLRTGLSSYPAYLAAWVSLGRVLRELKDDAGAIDPLSKALQLDPGNVVAARLLADAYLATGDKVEAIKKYKLVHALLPSDETLETQIAALERDLGSGTEPAPELHAAPTPVEEPVLAPVVESEPEFFAPAVEESPFDKTVPPFGDAAQILGEKSRQEEKTGDAEPMSFAHEESPFEDPVASYGEAALEMEAPAGIHIASAPIAAEVPAPAIDEMPVIDEAPLVEHVSSEVPMSDDATPLELPQVDAFSVFSTEEAQPVDALPDPFETESESELVAPRGDAADTLTMADLYARQGLIDDARHIYENILARDPANGEVRAKLMALTPPGNPKIVKLEQWLAKVAPRGAGSV